MSFIGSFPPVVPLELTDTGRVLYLSPYEKSQALKETQSTDPTTEMTHWPHIQQDFSLRPVVLLLHGRQYATDFSLLSVSLSSFYLNPRSINALESKKSAMTC